MCDVCGCKGGGQAGRGGGGAEGGGGEEMTEERGILMAVCQPSHSTPPYCPAAHCSLKSPTTTNK